MFKKHLENALDNINFWSALRCQAIGPADQGRTPPNGIFCWFLLNVISSAAHHTSDRTELLITLNAISHTRLGGIKSSIIGCHLSKDLNNTRVLLVMRRTLKVNSLLYTFLLLLLLFTVLLVFHILILKTFCNSVEMMGSTFKADTNPLISSWDFSPFL